MATSQQQSSFPSTPPGKDKTNNTTTTTTPDRRHTRHKSQSAITTPLPIHQHQRRPTISRHHSRSQSQSILTTPISSHDLHDLTLNPAFHHHDIDSPLHFSPSKARAAAQASQQLATLTRWLQTMLVSQEQDDDNGNHALVAKWQAELAMLNVTDPDLASEIVRWLEDVMFANRSADELRRLVFEAQVSELDGAIARDTKGSRHSLADRLLGSLLSILLRQSVRSLDYLSETAVQLGIVPLCSSSIPLGKDLARALMSYTLRSQDLQCQVEDMQSLLRRLTKQLDEVGARVTAFESERRTAGKKAEIMHPQTVQWNRETKQILIKIKEYQDRAKVLERTRPGFEADTRRDEALVKVEDVVEMQNRVAMRRSNVGELEEAVRSVSGLPPDLEASREEVRRAKSELERLKARREELFGMIADR